MTLDDFVYTEDKHIGDHFRHKDSQLILVIRAEFVDLATEIRYRWYLDLCVPGELKYKHIFELFDISPEYVSQEYINLLLLKYSKI